MRPSIAVTANGCNPGSDPVALARQLRLPLIGCGRAAQFALVLEFVGDRLVLRDLRAGRVKPLYADVDARLRRYRSLPAPRRGPLARAVGRKTRTVVDATAGWGQDLALLVAMGLEVVAVERSAVMGALLRNGLDRMRAGLQDRLAVPFPRLVVADAAAYLSGLTAAPDCVYLDPMFPARRKSSALAKRRIRLLREIVGSDEDRSELLRSALSSGSKRVVVKRPCDAPPLPPEPDTTEVGKLVCYDVYLGNRPHRP